MQAHPINTVFCIGRNYVDHIAELNNETPSEPLVFLKPNNSINLGKFIKLPEYSNNVHYETELVIQIGQDCDVVEAENAWQYIHAFAVGLDLTARDTQDIIKQKGLPWTKAKAFKGAACLSPWVDAQKFSQNTPIEFSLILNGQKVQYGHTDFMIYSIQTLIAYLAQTYGLKQGDIVFTGTPAGVGQLKSGDVLELNLMQEWSKAQFQVA